jgi:hypothetical protein
VIAEHAEQRGETIVSADGVRRVYGEGDAAVEALRGVDLHMAGGALVVFIGVALLSNLLVGPLAAVVGAPLERTGGVTGASPAATPCETLRARRAPPPRS